MKYINIFFSFRSPDDLARYYNFPFYPFIQFYLFVCFLFNASFDFIGRQSNFVSYALNSYLIITTVKQDIQELSCFCFHKVGILGN